MVVFLLACLVPAERKGVELPKPGGVEALSMEDLKRDTWRLVEPVLEGRGFGTPGYDEGVRRLEQRFGEMSLSPVFRDGFRRSVGQGTAVCGRHVGRSGLRAVLAIDDGVGLVTGALPAAALISLAKVSDQLGDDRPTDLLFCVTPDEAALADLTRGAERVLVVEGLDPEAPLDVQGERVLRVNAQVERDPDGVDYQDLRAHTQGLWHALSGA